MNTTFPKEPETTGQPRFSDESFYVPYIAVGAIVSEYAGLRGSHAHAEHNGMQMAKIVTFDSERPEQVRITELQTGDTRMRSDPSRMTQPPRRFDVCKDPRFRVNTGRVEGPINDSNRLRHFLRRLDLRQIDEQQTLRRDLPHVGREVRRRE